MGGGSLAALRFPAKRWWMVVKNMTWFVLPSLPCGSLGSNVSFQATYDVGEHHEPPRTTCGGHFEVFAVEGVVEVPEVVSLGCGPLVY